LPFRLVAEGDGGQEQALAAATVFRGPMRAVLTASLASLAATLRRYC
jgi:hypothetical protein